MTGGGIDRRGPKDSENAHNSFLTKCTEKGFWRFATDMDNAGLNAGELYKEFYRLFISKRRVV